MWHTHISPGRRLAAAALGAGLIAGALFVACSDGTSPGENLLAASVVLTPATGVVDVGGTLQLTATVKDASGKVLDIPVAFTSQNQTVAAVNATGLVTALALGEATITATAGGASGTARITVASAVATIDLTPALSVIEIGDSVRLAASPKDESGKPIDRAVTWESSNTSVATVDAQGLVLGTGVGSADITAAAGGKEAKAQVSVQARADSIAISGAPSGNKPVTVGGTLQLTAVVTDSLGNALDRQVTWASSAPGIATVDQTGLVTGVAVGDFTITATYKQLSAAVALRVAEESTE